MLSPSVRLAICYLLLFFAVLSCLIDFVAIGDGDGAQTTKEARRLQIGVKKRPEVCDTKARKGDVLHMHYKGTLEDGTEFDNSYKRGDPLSFTLGSGQVIRGWDQGLLAMCAGEKRKTGDSSGAGLRNNGGHHRPFQETQLVTFEVELVKIDRKTELVKEGTFSRSRRRGWRELRRASGVLSHTIEE
uniref:peptidylprolyl isomerase n=1 Tax=Ixodes ricinus TaxID=34613 RepID=A0A090XCG9_IXORI